MVWGVVSGVWGSSVAVCMYSEHVTTRNLTASINRVAMSVWPHEEEFIRAVLPYLGCNTGGTV